MKIPHYRAWLKTEQRMVQVAGILWNEDGTLFVRFNSKTPGGATSVTWLPGCDVELMQCTGLKDKNGNDVYGGDIVKGTLPDHGNPLEEVREVVYRDDMLLKPFHEVADYDANIWMECLNKSGFAIIGNIYENPELIPEDKQ